MKANIGDRVEFVLCVYYDLTELLLVLSGTIVGEMIGSYDIRLDSKFSSKEDVVLVTEHDICRVLDKKCTCDIKNLMYRGCKCGAMQK